MHEKCLKEQRHDKLTVITQLKFHLRVIKSNIGFVLQQNDLLMNFPKTVIQNLVKYLPLYLYF